ncbi:rho GTPase-activating protein 30 [Megalops cyprinoides]|uniref:rho GTPase-activating protein 30 n=1 Tax=Megalops cyprinoides TaxID=118141 RepID=UPI00186423DC|nr:rho GTPase-activating protein 30 [Megalops cyprinoides]
MRRGRRKGGSRDKVFGCDLLEHLAASCQDIPLVLRCCSEFIEEHGIVDGIYRLSGVSSNTQRLRNEFDSEGNPDLCKDVYLQDIHCVSSLCKAYFRELPNPLLTYQLYDKFADAVAVQLEEERLVKFKEVLKELPSPHYRTLEYLMHHLVRMASHASQTNMHVRNLAIVWAPNLLRSRDIEATGFNGTAAFMEVRVQSIVVEFILTHVSQLFPGPDPAPERRKSLPSPSILCSQDDQFFRAIPFPLPSALSPGDGPPPMRPYHAIIEGTDKRKGSLKGRKWKSIFNLGGRLHDPRRKNKASSKDKEKPVLRPAKSMDSLSSVPYSQEGSRHQPSPPLAREAGPAGGVVGGAGSGYAVTYRRGGGACVSVVSGGGTQGTYSRLDSGGGTTDGQTPPPRSSPAISSRADRRAGIHISGPFSVTVPLHITSGLALGVLQGGAQRDDTHDTTEEGLQGRDGETEREERRESEEREREEQGEREGEKDSECVEETEPEGGTGKRERSSVGGGVETISSSEEEPEYMDMRKNKPLSPTEDFHDLPLDFQDTFGFLDLIESGVSNQMNEFSVEPPCPHEEEEEEEEEDDQGPPGHPADPRPCSPSPLEQQGVQPSNPSCQAHRPLTFDPHGRACKSHSLPYKSRSFCPAPSSTSEDEDDDLDEDDGSDEEENMLFYSLPSSLQFENLKETDAPHGHSDKTNLKSAQHENISNDTNITNNINTNTAEQSERQPEDRLRLDTDPLGHKVAAVEAGGGHRGRGGDCLQQRKRMEEQEADPEEDAGLAGSEEEEEEEEEEEDVCGVKVLPHSDSGERDLAAAHSSVERPLLRTVHGSPASERRGGGESAGSHPRSCADLCGESVNGAELRAAVPEGSESAEAPSEPQEGTDRPPSSPVLLPEPCRVPSVNSDPEQVSLREEETQVSPGNPEETWTEGEGERDKGEEWDRVREVERGRQGEEEKPDNHTCPDLEKQEVEEERDESCEKDVISEEQEGQERSGVGHTAKEHMLKDESESQLLVRRRDEKERKEGGEDREEPGEEKPREEGRTEEEEKRERGAGMGAGLGRTVVCSKHSQPKVYLARAVPVVPPKPQLSKLAALNLRHQLQQRETERGREGERDRERERERGRDGDKEESRQEGEKDEMIRDGEREGGSESEVEKCREEEGEVERELKRNSAVSICFDEAVARATERRERERERGREGQTEHRIIP